MPSGLVQVRRPRAIVFDILGTASKSGFLERILFPFFKSNLDPYLNTHWNKHDFNRLYKRIQDFSTELNKTEPSTPIVLAHNTTQAKPSLLNFLNFCQENGIQSPAVTQLRFKVWFEGYQTSRLLTPIYSDVPASLRRWFAEGIKFYVFSNTWVEAQKALLRNTNHGDLTNLITGHFDNDFGPLNEADSWRRLCAQIHESPNNVLFLTKAVQEARAAQDAGMQVVLVLTHRHNVKAIGHDDRQRFAYVRTLNDLQWLEGSMMPSTGGGAEMPPPPSSSQPQSTTQVAVTQQTQATQATPATGASSPTAATAAAASASMAANAPSASGHSSGAAQANASRSMSKQPTGG